MSRNDVGVMAPVCGAGPSLAYVEEFGLKTCQLVCWDPSLFTDKTADQLSKTVLRTATHCGLGAKNGSTWSELAQSSAVVVNRRCLFPVDDDGDDDGSRFSFPISLQSPNVPNHSFKMVHHFESSAFNGWSFPPGLPEALYGTLDTSQQAVVREIEEATERRVELTVEESAPEQWTLREATAAYNAFLTPKSESNTPSTGSRMVNH